MCDFHNIFTSNRQQFSFTLQSKCYISDDIVLFMFLDWLLDFFVWDKWRQFKKLTITAFHCCMTRRRCAIMSAPKFIFLLCFWMNACFLRFFYGRAAAGEKVVICFNEILIYEHTWLFGRSSSSTGPDAAALLTETVDSVGDAASSLLDSKDCAWSVWDVWLGDTQHDIVVFGEQMLAEDPRQRGMAVAAGGTFDAAVLARV